MGACSSQYVRIVLKGNVVSREVFTLAAFMVFVKALIFFYVLCNSRILFFDFCISVCLSNSLF